MQPETPSQNLNPEQLPVHNEQNVEILSSPNSPDIGIEKGLEAYEKKSELSSIAADMGLTTATPISTPTPFDNTITSTSTTLAGNPMIANDDDLIEKEWVDKAKKIVAETQNNPYKRDEEVNKLQIDYMKKRFGRELGVAE